jgi:hypothetical protein
MLKLILVVFLGHCSLTGTTQELLDLNLSQVSYVAKVMEMHGAAVVTQCSGTCAQQGDEETYEAYFLDSASHKLRHVFWHDEDTVLSVSYTFSKDLERVLGMTVIDLDKTLEHIYEYDQKNDMLTSKYLWMKDNLISFWEYKYDRSDRLTQMIKYNASEKPLIQYNYDYCDANTIVEKKKVWKAGKSIDGVQHCYRTNSQGQIEFYGTDANNYSEFNYSEGGLITSEKIFSGVPERTWKYSYPENCLMQKQLFIGSALVESYVLIMMPRH